MASNHSKAPCIRVTDLDNEYIVFLDESGQIESIVVFTHNRRIGNHSKLQELPWSARWQIEQEMSNFIP